MHKAGSSVFCPDNGRHGCFRAEPGLPVYDTVADEHIYDSPAIGLEDELATRLLGPPVELFHSTGKVRVCPLCHMMHLLATPNEQSRSHGNGESETASHDKSILHTQSINPRLNAKGSGYSQ